MSEKLELLEQKVRQVLESLDKVREDNRSLRTVNIDLKSQLSKLAQEVESLKRDQRDQAETVKTKLTSVLGRLEELEKTGF